MIALTPEELVQRYPHLYHMAELGSWPSIRRYGLLSTTALLDLYEVNEGQRRSIESEWRPGSISITHPTYGTAVIRDQKPMPPAMLEGCLIDMSPKDWYEFLNRKTFFWTERRRLENLLNAFAYRGRAHCVLTVDTRALLNRHEKLANLSEINSGFVYHGGARGRDTFRPIAKFPSGHRVWELAVEHSVPDVADLVIRVEDWRGGTMLTVVWERE